MVLLQLDPFLTKLTSMFEHSIEKGSVWVTIKRYVYVSVLFNVVFFIWLNFWVYICGNWKVISGFMFVVVASTSLKSKVQRNKLATAGEAIEYRCLIRATDGKKTISTSVGLKEHQRFQASYSTILKAHMTALKRERKDKKKSVEAGKREGSSKKPKKV